MFIKTADGWRSLVPAFVSSLKDTPRDFSDMFPDLRRKVEPKLEAKLDTIREDHVKSMVAKGYRWN
jgi:hypothetical protein